MPPTRVTARHTPAKGVPDSVKEMLWPEDDEDIVEPEDTRTH